MVLRRQARQLEGAEFEQEFLGDMVQHPMMGSGRANTCSLLAARELLVGMCEMQAMVQSVEAVMMETWLREWYLECAMSPEG